MEITAVCGQAQRSGSNTQWNGVFFTKGTYINDSRSHTGLSHRLEVYRTTRQHGWSNLVTLSSGIQRWLRSLVARECGRYWCCQASVHLYKADGIARFGFRQRRAQSDVMPGDSAEIPISVTFTLNPADINWKSIWCRRLSSGSDCWTADADDSDQPSPK